MDGLEGWIRTNRNFCACILVASVFFLPYVIIFSANFCASFAFGHVVEMDSCSRSEVTYKPLGMISANVSVFGELHRDVAQGCGEELVCGRIFAARHDAGRVHQPLFGHQCDLDYQSGRWDGEKSSVEGAEALLLWEGTIGSRSDLLALATSWPHLCFDNILCSYTYSHSDRARFYPCNERLIIHRRHNGLDNRPGTAPELYPLRALTIN